MINIYTDASVSTGVATATCMLLSDRAFIGYDTHTYENVPDSKIGELLAIRDGLRLYDAASIKDENVTLYTDHEYAVRIIEERLIDKLPNIREVISEIIQLVDKYDICVEHITAHQLTHNPNKIVDQLSRRGLRTELRRRK